MSFFSGKVVIVTGSSNGIGRGTAVLFAKEGAKVTITGRNAAALEETKQECFKAGAKVEDILELIGDITDASFAEQLVVATVAKFGQLDVLVNNAGGSNMANYGKGIMDIPLAEFDKMLDLNVKPVLRISQLAVPHLVKTKGAIVNISSIGSFHYLTPMAGSLIKQGIRVNSINPGAVQTNIVVNMGASKEAQDKMFSDIAASSSIPLGRVATPEDIGKLILFLADRSKSEIIIGHILTADGGTTLKSTMFPDS